MTEAQANHLLYKVTFSSVWTVKDFVDNYKKIRKLLPDAYQLDNFTEAQYNRLGKHLDKIESGMYCAIDVALMNTSKNDRAEAERIMTRLFKEFEYYRTMFRLVRHKRYPFSPIGLMWYRFKQVLKQTFALFSKEKYRLEY